MSDKRCGTCSRWDTYDKYVTPPYGVCRVPLPACIDVAEREWMGPDEGAGCFYWSKEASHDKS